MISESARLFCSAFSNMVTILYGGQQTIQPATIRFAATGTVRQFPAVWFTGSRIMPPNRTDDA